MRVAQMFPVFTEKLQKSSRIKTTFTLSISVIRNGRENILINKSLIPLLKSAIRRLHLEESNRAWGIMKKIQRKVLQVYRRQLYTVSDVAFCEDIFWYLKMMNMPNYI